VAPRQSHLPGQHLWVGGPTLFLVFCSPPRLFYRNPKLIATYRDWQKTWHRDPSLPLRAGSDGNSLIRRAVSTNSTQDQCIGHAPQLIKFLNNLNISLHYLDFAFAQSISRQFGSKVTVFFHLDKYCCRPILTVNRILVLTSLSQFL
jgi:hypothetical protein